jgi:hypothetical protein
MSEMQERRTTRRLAIPFLLVTLAVWTPTALEASGPVPAAEPSSADADVPASQVTPIADEEELLLDLQMRIAGSTLKPRSNTVDYNVSGQGGCVYATGGNQLTWWNTPLWLPQGAEVVQFRFYFDDTSAADSTAYLTIYDLYGNIVDEFSAQSFGSTGTGYSTSNPINHRVDYATYSYVMNWRPSVIGSEMQLCGFRIYYTAP